MVQAMCIIVQIILYQGNCITIFLSFLVVIEKKENNDWRQPVDKAKVELILSV